MSDLIGGVLGFVNGGSVKDARAAYYREETTYDNARTLGADLTIVREAKAIGNEFGLNTNSSQVAYHQSVAPNAGNNQRQTPADALVTAVTLAEMHPENQQFQENAQRAADSLRGQDGLIHVSGSVNKFIDGRRVSINFGNNATYSSPDIAISAIANTLGFAQQPTVAMAPLSPVGAHGPNNPTGVAPDEAQSPLPRVNYTGESVTPANQNVSPPPPPAPPSAEVMKGPAHPETQPATATATQPPAASLTGDAPATTPPAAAANENTSPASKPAAPAADAAEATAKPAAKDSMAPIPNPPSHDGTQMVRDTQAAIEALGGFTGTNNHDHTIGKNHRPATDKDNFQMDGVNGKYTKADINAAEAALNMTQDGKVSAALLAALHDANNADKLKAAFAAVPAAAEQSAPTHHHHSAPAKPEAPAAAPAAAKPETQTPPKASLTGQSADAAPATANDAPAAIAPVAAAQPAKPVSDLFHGNSDFNNYASVINAPSLVSQPAVTLPATYTAPTLASAHYEFGSAPATPRGNPALLAANKSGPGPA